MKRVKGSILIDFVKTIKATKNPAFDAYLTEADRTLFSQRLLPSGWYPYESFRRAFQAVFELLAGKDLEKVRQWGQTYGETIISGYYKGMVREGHPMESLERYHTYWRNFFDFGEVLVEPQSDREAMVIIRGIDPDFVPQYYMMLGWIERSLEMCGARKIHSQILAAAWKGEPETRVKMSWTV